MIPPTSECARFPRTNIRQTEGLRTLCRHRHGHRGFRNETSLRSKGTCVSPSGGTLIWPALGLSPRTQRRPLYELSSPSCCRPAPTAHSSGSSPHPPGDTLGKALHCRWLAAPPHRGAGTAASCRDPELGACPPTAASALQTARGQVETPTCQTLP